MKEFLTIKLDGKIPVLATAIHDGHQLSDSLISLSALSESERLREEDPFTGIWTEISGNRIIGHQSRFEFDLNRPPEKAIYMVPADAWGLNLWKTTPSGEILANSQLNYSNIYKEFHSSIASLLEKFGSLVVYDLHSYNHRRMGPDASPEDESENPEINLGTGTMDRNYWGNLVERFISDIKSYNYYGRQLDVRENVKFKGGYFSRWIHQNFPESVCCISIEMKKFFMDEWTGVPDYEQIDAIGKALKSTIPGVIKELSKIRS